MLEIFAARESYNSGAISNIGFVRSQFNMADGLTKSLSQAAPLHILSTAKQIPKFEQWILRPPEQTPSD